MTRPIDRQTFERSLVNYASPTLANIKAAALFTFPGPYARTNSQARSAHKIEKRRRELLALIDRISQELNPKGINIRVLVWRSCGALIYICGDRAPSPPTLPTGVSSRHLSRQATTRAIRIPV